MELLSESPFLKELLFPYVEGISLFNGRVGQHFPI